MWLIVTGPVTHVTCAVMNLLICPHSPSGSCGHIRQIPPVHVTYLTSKRPQQVFPRGLPKILIEYLYPLQLHVS